MHYTRYRQVAFLFLFSFGPSRILEVENKKRGRAGDVGFGEQVEIMGKQTRSSD